MKASISIVSTFLLLVVFLFSCKHEIPVGADNGSNNTNNNNPPTGGSQTCSADTVYFANQILPLLNSSCAMSGCHDAASHQDGVILTNYASIMNTADVNPGNPNGSDLYEVLNETDPDKIMPRPPASPLTAAQKQLIYRWILQGAKNNACNGCDTAVFSFSGAIAPLVNSYCKGCHSGTAPSGSIDLTSYNGIKAIAVNGKFYGAISHSAGISPMPKNASKLSDCQLMQVQKWIAAGSPNN